VYASAVGSICAQLHLVNNVMNKLAKNENSNSIFPKSSSTLRFFLCVLVYLAQVLTKFQHPKTETFIWQDLQGTSTKVG
jgi:hypothetical protein